MTTSQTYEDYIKLKSIFDVLPPPTPDELEGAGLSKNITRDEYLKMSDERSCYIDLCSLLYNRWFFSAANGQDMRKASDYFLQRLPLAEQKRFRQLRAQPIAC